MVSCNVLALMTALITFLSATEGFFLYSNKKSNVGDLTNGHFPNKDYTVVYIPVNCRTPREEIDNESTERLMPPPQYYREGIAGPANNWGAQYTFDGAGPVTVALPVAVPIQAQMAQVPKSLKGTVHNVQLVPCLCPVSNDVDPTYLSSIQTPQQPQPQPSSPGYIVQTQQAPTQTA